MQYHSNMKNILDLFSNYSELCTKVKAQEIYLKVITEAATTNPVLIEQIKRGVQNNVVTLTNAGEHDTAQELAKLL